MTEIDKPKSRKRTVGGDAPDFEKALTRLEAIVTEMEGGKLSLENMVARFEEGQGLIKACTEKLNEVEKKIEILVRHEDGTDGTQPFEAGEEPEEKAEGGKPAARGGRDLF